MDDRIPWWAWVLGIPLVPLAIFWVLVIFGGIASYLVLGRLAEVLWPPESEVEYLTRKAREWAADPKSSPRWPYEEL